MSAMECALSCSQFMSVFKEETTTVLKLAACGQPKPGIVLLAYLFAKPLVIALTRQQLKTEKKLQ